jgi:hypothetical protein
MPTINKSSKPYPWTRPKEVAFAKEQWRTKLYNSQRWRKLSKMEIADEPFCIECYTKRDLLVTDGLQRDHVNGFTNEHEFWHGERQTLCKPCNMSKAGKAGRNKQTGGGVNP